MDSRVQMEFLDRFTIMTKLDFCFSICSLILEVMEKDDKKNIDLIKREWESAITERFKIGIDTLKEYESITEDDVKSLNTFLAATLKEMKLK